MATVFESSKGILSGNFVTFIQLVLLIFCYVAVRILNIVGSARSSRRNGQRPTAASSRWCRQMKKKTPIRTMVVLGSGGHTTELLALCKRLDRDRYELVYVKASTDTTSASRVQQQNSDCNTTVTIYDIPRSREVGQSYASSVGSTLYATVYAFRLVFAVRPDLVLCNGPGTCLPIAVAAFIGRIFCVMGGRIIFCESFCRVQTLSLTGKLLYAWVDIFIVHWPDLHRKFPMSVLGSSFVPN